MLDLYWRLWNGYLHLSVSAEEDCTRTPTGDEYNGTTAITRFHNRCENWMDAVEEDTEQEDTKQQDTEQEDTEQQDISQQDTSQQDTNQENTDQQDSEKYAFYFNSWIILEL